MHKLRNAMDRRDSEYKLLGSIELDEGFFSTQYNGDEPLKQGRGSQTKTKVLVMTENEPASLTTDDSTSYVHFKNLVKEHTAQVIQPKDISKVLPWVHIMISNAKRQLLDIYHSIKP